MMHKYRKMCKHIMIIFAVCAFVFGTWQTAFGDPAGTESEKYVSIDFDEVDIRVFIKFISELTQKNFIIDNRVKGNVSIISPGKITVKEAYRVFESVLEVHGFTAVESGEVSKIIPMPVAREKNVETRLKNTPGVTEDKIVTQLIPLNYADVNLIKQLFTPMISKGSIFLAYEPTNTAIITDVYSNIKRLIKIIEVIDVKDVGRKITVFPVQFANAEKLVKTLSSLFKAQVQRGKKMTIDQQSQFVADERTNSIILLANDFDTEKVLELLKIMDQEVPKSDAKIRVIYLENAKAEDLATVLQAFSGTVNKKEEGKKIAPVVSDKVKITHDAATNSLIIMADKDDYQVLEGIVKKLDIPRPMVYIEALIMEVRDTDDFALGVEWNFGTSAGEIDTNESVAFGGFNATGNGINSLPSVTDGSAALAGGFSVGIMSEAITIGGITFQSLGAAIKAVKTNEKVRIISTPQILTTDNEEAEISVGENVPYLTSNSSGDSTYNNYEYKDVGVNLKITPQISQGRFVRLNIYQKTEKLSTSSTADVANTPTTLKRTAETTVVVKDAATVVIGGLIGEDLSSVDQQTPCLGGIPVLGNLFKSKSKSGIQTNLYIFLTPRIIQNPAEAQKVYQEKKESIEDLTETQIPMYRGADEPAAKGSAE
ncbi:type II secretion system secretin GspD [Desulfobacter latus]|uniref:Type II secretion system secretin GspD n=1 Tax=Desulfobacter latus TaxID=2292 RepID=A0A850T3H4_9BACT|nr:type II secretion system secretin GspD [Desulfobacter latus]NWH05641.1 type II secretion system secretin GspD [Desulfobacter latus]